jgi:hypothetical protein
VSVATGEAAGEEKTNLPERLNAPFPLRALLNEVSELLVRPVDLRFEDVSTVYEGVGMFSGVWGVVRLGGQGRRKKRANRTMVCT